jgi:hypothetical protein
MGFKFKRSVELLLIVLLWVGFAAAANGDKRLITVLVNNSAEIPAPLLSKAEMEVDRVFDEAGIEIAWVHCVRGSSSDGDPCRHVLSADEFVLHIVMNGKTSSDSVFGEAFLGEDGSGNYCDVFFDRIEEAHRKSGTNVARLLGTVVAHELGHLLLGLHAHSRTGIMAAVWAQESMREMDRGALLFTAGQSRLMKERLEKGERGELTSRTSWKGNARIGGY